MSEQKLDITTKGKYSNIDLRQLKVGNSIIVEKIFAEGRPMPSKFATPENPKNTYACKVKYEGTDVGMWLNKEEEHQAFAQCGGIGDLVKITCNVKEVEITLKGVKTTKLVRTMAFEQTN